MSDSLRCTAHTSAGRRCKKPPVRGATVCATHRGSAPQVRRAAARRAAQLDAHQQAERMLAEAGVDADPIEHLVDSLRRTAALAIVYGQMVADLDHTTAQGDTDQPRGTLGYRKAPASSKDELRVEANDRLLGLDRHGAAQLHPFVVEYHRLLEVRVKLAKMAIDTGEEERWAQIPEEQGQVIVQVLRATLEDLGGDVTSEVASTVGRTMGWTRCSCSPPPSVRPGASRAAGVVGATGSPDRRRHLPARQTICRAHREPLGSAPPREK